MRLSNEIHALLFKEIAYPTSLYVLNDISTVKAIYHCTQICRVGVWIWAYFELQESESEQESVHVKYEVQMYNPVEILKELV